MNKASTSAVLLFTVCMSNVTPAWSISINSAKSLLTSQEAGAFVLSRLGFFAGNDTTALVTASGQYSDTGFDLSISSDWQGSALSVTYTGVFDLSTNTINFVGVGSYGQDPWSTTGKAVFSGSDDEFMSYEENGRIGSQSWYWWALGGEVIGGVLAGVIGTPATGLAVGGALLSASGVVIAIDSATNPPKPNPPAPPQLPQQLPVPNPVGPNGGKVISLTNTQNNGGVITINDYDNHGIQTVSISGNGTYQNGAYTTIYRVPEPTSTLLALLGIGVFAITHGLNPYRSKKLD